MRRWGLTARRGQANPPCRQCERAECGVELAVFGVNGPEEIVSASDAAKAGGVEALNFLATPLFSLPGTRNNAIVMERIAALRLPAMFQWPETAEAGALAGYGPRFADSTVSGREWW